MNPFVSPAERAVHIRALRLLEGAGVPFLVGGAYAMFHYTGVVRYTKDLDVFLRRADEPRAREVLAEAGYRTLVKEPLWLSKAFWGETFVDLIYSSGNGVAVVDDVWLEAAPSGDVLGVASRIVPPEEMIWSKAFVQERERWDGADVAHLVRACGAELDWDRLLRRFAGHWQVLLAHLSLFAFSYPQDRDAVPPTVWRRLLTLAARQVPEPAEDKLCRGTLLSRTQYLPDLGLWGYRDAREVEVPGFTPPPDAEVCAPLFASRVVAAAPEADSAAAAADL
jgi:hypothetical protein